MKNFSFLSLLIFACISFTFAQGNHFNQTYPVITEEDSNIRGMMNQVSIDSLVATINKMSSFHTRRYDSRFIYDVQDWLLGRYQVLNIDSLYLHDFEMPDLSCTQSADNIIAIQYGTKYPDEFVVCGAHYDSYAWDGYDPDTIRSPGADDNATGVAGILEAARILSKHSFERSIIYCSFNAEEAWLRGSTAFAEDCAAGDMNIVAYFNMDMNGYLEEGSDIHIHLIYIPESEKLADFVYNFGDVYLPDIPITQNWLSGGDSDHSAFHRNGYPAIFPFEDVNFKSPYIHTRNDVMGLSVNNMEQSRIFAQLNLGCVATIAGFIQSSVEENEKENIEIYPNPSNNQVNINGDVSKIEAFDLLGRKVFSQDNLVGQSMKIDVSNLMSGIYIIKMYLRSGSVAVEKINVNH